MVFSYEASRERLREVQERPWSVQRFETLPVESQAHGHWIWLIKTCSILHPAA